MLKRFVLLLVALTSAMISTANAETYTWNNTGTVWNSASSWSPSLAGPDMSDSDIGRFTPNSSAFGSGVSNPSLADPSHNVGALSLTIAPNQNLGGWTFTGTSADNLTVGGPSSTGLTTYGPQITTFNGPTIKGKDPTNTLKLNINYGSTLVLSGTSAITAQQGGLNINGGTLKLDNSVTNVGDRLQVSNIAGTPIIIAGGGTIHLVGSTGNTTVSRVGNLPTTVNERGGVNTVRVENNGGLTTLDFYTGNANAGKPGTRAVVRYEAVSGQLGALSTDATGSRITLFTAPGLGTNKLLGSTTTGVGFATVKDSDGINFATYKFDTPSDKRGVISVANANSGQTVTPVSTASGLQGFSTTSIGQFDAVAGATTGFTANVTTGSLRITPAGSGSSLDMGAFNLVTNALMLNGSNDFAINGTGSFGAAAGSKYIYVNDASATLSTSLKFISSTASSTVFAGPGFVDLTGTAQNTSGTTNRFVIAGGVVRGNDAQIGFTSTGPGVISLTGGVLEIKDGLNLPGALADFTRSLGGTGPGKVSWGGNVATEKGSGGFSAFGSAASVNIGGSAIPTTLTWNSNDSIGDGYALKFGSTKSNNTLNFLNGINLENGADYQLREINVTKGTGTIADRTTISGVISGSVVADFIKTGNGVLEFKAVNTYGGNTLVQGGTLLANGITATGTGNTSVYTGATLGGTGTVLGNTNVAGGGTIQGGEGFVVNQSLTVTQVTLSNNANLRAVLGNGGTATDLTTTGASRLVTVGAFGRDSTSSIINIQLTNAATDGLNLDGTHTYTRRLATYTSLTNLTEGTYNAGAAGNPFNVSGTNFAVNSNWIVTVSATSFDVTFSPMSPVPEPSTVFAIGAAGLGLLGAFRRYHKRV